MRKLMLVLLMLLAATATMGVTHAQAQTTCSYNLQVVVRDADPDPVPPTPHLTAFVESGPAFTDCNAASNAAFNRVAAINSQGFWDWATYTFFPPGSIVRVRILFLAQAPRGR